MLNFPITTQLTRKLVKKFILNTINSHDIESRYISLQLQLMSKDNDIIDFGNIFMLDKSNSKSINGCLFYFNFVYNNDFLIQNDLEISHLIINYKEVNRSDYLTYIKNFYRDK